MCFFYYIGFLIDPGEKQQIDWDDKATSNKRSFIGVVTKKIVENGRNFKTGVFLGQKRKMISLFLTLYFKFLRQIET